MYIVHSSEYYLLYSEEILKFTIACKFQHAVFLDFELCVSFCMGKSTSRFMVVSAFPEFNKRKVFRKIKNKGRQF